MKKNKLFLIACMLVSHIVGLYTEVQSNHIMQCQDAVTIIHAMEQSIEIVDKISFTNFLHAYITRFGQVYEKQAGVFEAYRNAYYISSNFDQSQLLTPVENVFLMQVLDYATQQNNWGVSIVINLSILDLKTMRSTTKALTLDEIRIAIKRVTSSVGYSRPVILVGAALGTLSVVGSLYYLAQQNSELVQQGTDAMKYGWQDFKDSMHQFSKYFTDPQSYEQFEKQHALFSQDMTEQERLQRFKEWQKGHRQEKSMYEKMKPVKAFEKKQGLLSQNITEEERLQRFKEWQKGDKQQQDINEKMKQVETFEKNMNISLKNIHYEDRIQRFEAWKKEEEHKKNIVAAEKWEQIYLWRIADRNGKNIKMNEEERIERYKNNTDPIERYALENGWIK